MPLTDQFPIFHFQPCSNVQASTSHLLVSWSTPGVLQGRDFRTKVAISRKAANGSWTFEAGTFLAASQQTNFTFTALSLGPGWPYRASVTFLIGTVSSEAHHSETMWIAATAPLPKQLTTKLPAPAKVRFSFDVI